MTYAQILQIYIPHPVHAHTILAYTPQDEYADVLFYRRYDRYIANYYQRITNSVTK